MNYKLNCIAASLFTVVVSFLMVEKTAAQVNPILGMYYQNQYLANPAYAGQNQGLTLNLGYKRELTKVEGTPVTNNITADYGMGKVGLGVNVNMDRDGLIDIFRYTATYAYHLPINDESKVSFGLSAGVTTEKINTGNIIGDEGDTEIGWYNNQTAYIDGDFGAAYTYKNITVQGVVPNLRKLFYKEEEERAYTPSTFYSALSYKFIGEVTTLEPKVVYRGIKNYGNIVDAGINASFLKDTFNILALYHSTKNVSAGLGFQIDNKYQLQFAYTSPFSGTLRQYSEGNLSIGLKIHFLQK